MYFFATMEISELRELIKYYFLHDKIIKEPEEKLEDDGDSPASLEMVLNAYDARKG